MRSWKNWFAPLLTCLTVLALALLPLRLSLLRDEQLTGIVHTEELAADSNFPARPPELPLRLHLLAQYLEGVPDTVTVIGQELEGTALDRAAQQAREELEALVRAGILPETVDGFSGNFSGGRVYLRDQTDLSSAGFLELSLYHGPGRADLDLRLDAETGRLVALEMNTWSNAIPDPDPAALGEALLNRLSLAYTRIPNDSAAAAGFRLADSQTLYWVMMDRSTLHLLPQVDWNPPPLSRPTGEDEAVK